MGILAAQYLGVQHPIGVEISGKSRLARDLGSGIRARNGTANSDQRILRLRKLRRLPLRCSLNGLDDSSVARAAAEVALERFLDFLVGGMGMSIEQSFGGHDHPRRTEATLHRPMLDESLLQRMQHPILLQPFDCFHARPIGAAGLVDARAHRPVVRTYRTNSLVIHNDRARPAVALTAAILGPHEMQLIPQHLKQGGLGADLDLVWGTINVEEDCRFFH